MHLGPLSHQGSQNGKAAKGQPAARSTVVVGGKPKGKERFLTETAIISRGVLKKC